MGHKVRTGGIQGDAHTIIVDEAGTIHGVPDPRRAAEMTLAKADCDARCDR